MTPGVAWSCAGCEPGSCGRVVVEAGAGAVVDVGAVDGGDDRGHVPARSATGREQQHRAGSEQAAFDTAGHATPLVVAEGRSVRPPGTVHAAGSDTFNNVRGQSRRCNTTLSSAEYTVSVASSSR